MIDQALRPFMYGKIHRAIVTDANRDYVGSITIDSGLLRAAQIFPHTAVDVVNVTNGSRLTTYAIEGPPGSGTVCLNGAAAHHFAPGDIAIIIGYEQVPACEIPGRVSRSVHVDSKNQITSIDNNVTSGFEEL